ncbi:MAG: hypothetical protein WC764_01215 [Candidatus Paceibacterota bacterium]|jgi:hypothetical protein
MPRKGLPDTRGRGASYDLAGKIANARLLLAAELLGKLTPEQQAALAHKDKKSVREQMADACAAINSGKTLVVKPEVVSPSAPPAQPRLKLVEGTTIVPSYDKFEVKKHFKLDTSAKAAVQIYYLGDNFKANFSNKIETDVEKAELRCHTLLRSSLDPEIMSELDEARRVIKLAHFWGMLLQQPRGETGPLLVNGYANIAYVEDENGVLWFVSAGWDSGNGWYVLARSVEGPLRWSVGLQVVSR